MFVSQTQDELYAYYKTIADSTTMPVIMYNNLPKTNVTITPDAAGDAQRSEAVLGFQSALPVPVHKLVIDIGNHTGPRRSPTRLKR